MSTSTESPRNPETRRAMLKQLAHLKEEVGALRRHLSIIPASVLVGRPLETDPSFKEIYALLCVSDEKLYAPAVERLAAGDGASLATRSDEELLAGEAWNEMDMEEIIGRVQSARDGLVETLETLPPARWHDSLDVDGERTDVFGLAYGIVQHDADLLRAAAYRLHESRLTSREEDLPK